MYPRVVPLCCISICRDVPEVGFVTSGLPATVNVHALLAVTTPATVPLSVGSLIVGAVSVLFVSVEVDEIVGMATPPMFAPVFSVGTPPPLIVSPAVSMPPEPPRRIRLVLLLPSLTEAISE